MVDLAIEESQKMDVPALSLSHTLSKSMVSTCANGTDAPTFEDSSSILGRQSCTVFHEWPTEKDCPAIEKVTFLVAGECYIQAWSILVCRSTAGSVEASGRPVLGRSWACLPNEKVLSCMLLARYVQMMGLLPAERYVLLILWLRQITQSKSMK